MSEMHFVAEFIQALDLIIKDDLSDLSRVKTPGVENAENRELLAIAARISRIDYSRDSKIRDTLKQKLLKKMKEQKTGGELSDTELDYAAGGLDEFRGKKD